MAYQITGILAARSGFSGFGREAGPEKKINRTGKNGTGPEQKTGTGPEKNGNGPEKLHRNCKKTKNNGTETGKKIKN